MGTTGTLMLHRIKTITLRTGIFESACIRCGKRTRSLMRGASIRYLEGQPCVPVDVDDMTVDEWGRAVA